MTARVRCFTFMEVMIAAAILAMSVAMVTGIVGAARARLLRAERRWGRQHLLANAAELYLLAGQDAQLPEGLLPQGFSAHCSVEEVEDLPEHAREIEGWTGWKLAQYRVAVFDPSGGELGEWVVEKVVHEDDLYGSR